MAYDQQLADRVLDILEDEAPVREQKMFGGLALMLHGHMCCGVIGDQLVLRLSTDQAAQVLGEPHTRPMDLTRRPMPGFVYVGPEGVSGEAAMRRYVAMAVEYVQTLPLRQPRPAHRRAPTARPRSFRD